MIYKLLSILFSWLIFNREKRQEFRQYCQEKYLAKALDSAQENYKKIIDRLKLKKNNNKLQVIFLVNDNAKWKTQSLYDILKASEDFEPHIVISLAEKQRELSKKEKTENLNENIKFFENKSIKTELGWDIEKNKAIALEKFSPDIVFYQQPWGIPNNQKPQRVGEYALTCYVPYYVPNFGILSMDCRTFHKFLFRYYVLNSDWAKIYEDYMGKYGKNIRTTGHTMLDNIQKSQSHSAKNYVIYAPHWSIKHHKNDNNTNYATFNEYGKSILEFAKNHKEINWVFKPHPKLHSTLETIGEMTIEEIDNYYKQWENLGIACYDGDYAEIFRESKALITDSASFLIEYFYTGNPVIHLISEDSRTEIPAPTKKILNTYYKVHNNEELKHYLDKVIIHNEDYNKPLREDILNAQPKELAAKNILQDLRNTLNKNN